jgi:hypothetical protein
VKIVYFYFREDSSLWHQESRPQLSLSLYSDLGYYNFILHLAGVRIYRSFSVFYISDFAVSRFARS